MAVGQDAGAGMAVEAPGADVGAAGIGLEVDVGGTGTTNGSGAAEEAASPL